MEHFKSRRLHRRDFERLAIAATVPAIALFAQDRRIAGVAVAQTEGSSGTLTLAPTPACGDDDALAATVPQTAGPFFTPNSPERQSLLEADVAGTRLIVRGWVYSIDCQPISEALLDFWQADDAGAYDNEGFRLRGHQFADDDGGFVLETIVPGLYPGRTRHIHVMAQAPHGPVLTTQLYFPNEPSNETDGIFNPALVMDVAEDEPGERLASFTFVL